MVLNIPPMKIISDNERLVPVVMKGKGGKSHYLRTVTSGPYKRCKAVLIRIMEEQIPPGWKPSENIVLEVFVHTYKDATNILKILCDALEESGVVKNDRHITTLFVCKFPIKRGQPDVVKLRVVNMEDKDGG